MSKWNELSMAEKAEMMKVAVRQGITNLSDIRQRYNEFAEGGSEEEEKEVNTNSYSVGNLVNALYQNNPKEKYLGEPEHHYDFTQSEEWANAHGYYPDARGHRDDRVKKISHPSHPSRGTWNGDKFVLTDFGMQNPNYTLFGLTDGGQDPQAVLTYQRGIVLPEVTITPKENYFFNPYDNIELHYAKGGKIHIKPENRGKFTTLKDRTGHSATWFKEHGTPAQKKMATFALNARHWKHGLGGNLFEGGGRRLEYHPEGDYYYGGIPFKVTVTGKNKKKRPYWVSPKGAGNTALTIGDLSKAYTAATVGLLPNPISAGINLSQGKVLNALEDMWLYNSAHSEDPNVNYGVVGFSAPEGSLFSSMSKAAKATPKQWTAAQDAAIARGDMAEAQRLRDLHFKVSAPNTVASVNGQPLQLYHGTDATFNAFDISKYGSTDGGTFGRGVYTTPVKEYAELYGKNNMPLYMKLDNPRDYRNSSIGDLMAEKLAFGDDFATGNGIDGVIGRPSWKGFKGLEEYVSHNPKNIKSSLPITYDNNGVRIPLGKRDNFNINDIRYGLLPFGIGLTGYGLLNNQEAFGGRIKKRKR